MGKVAKGLVKVATIIGGIAAIATGIGTVLGGTMMLSIFGTSIAASSIAAAAGLVATAGGLLMRSGGGLPQSQAHLGRLSAQLDTRAPRKMVLGRTAMPVDIRYYEGSGENEEYIDYIICVAAHRVLSIEEIWFEDTLAWTVGGGVQGQFAGYLTSVTPVLEGTAANTIAINGGTRWGVDARLTGCAYLHARIKRSGNSDNEQSPLASGLPQRVTIIGEGMPEYDPRFDSTAGGSGPMRADDQSTWGPSTGNPIIQSLNVLLGWRINGKLSVGAGLPVKYLLRDSAVTAANICDEDIALAGGGTQKRYRTAGVFSTNDVPMSIVAALLSGCAGELLDSDGRLSFLIKTNTLAAPVVEFDADDVLSAGLWDAMGGLDDIPNVIAGNFTDPSSNSLYQMVPYPSVSIASEDGIERTAPIDFAVVENSPQAERLAKQTLQRFQYPGTFTAEYNMKAMAALLGKIVWQTYPPRGWVNKPFRVISQKPSRSGNIALVLREEHASIYSWSAEDSAPVQVAEPVAFDPLNTGPILLARRAGETAIWENVTGDGRPEDGATAGTDVILVSALPEIGEALPGRFYQTSSEPNLLYHPTGAAQIAATYSASSNFNFYTALANGGAGLRDGAYVGHASIHGTNGSSDQWIEMAFAQAVAVNDVLIGAAVVTDGWNNSYTNGADLQKKVGGAWTTVATVAGVANGGSVTSFAINETVEAIRLRRNGFLAVGEFYAVSGGWRVVSTIGPGNLVLNSDGTLIDENGTAPVNLGSLDALDLPNGPETAGATRIEDGSGNLIPTPITLAGATFFNGAKITVVNSRTTTHLFSNSSARFSDFFAVRGGEKLFFSYEVFSTVSNFGEVLGGYTWKDAAGTETSVDLTGTTVVGTDVVGEANREQIGLWLAMPTAAVSVRFYVKRPAGGSGSFHVLFPYVGRSQLGSDVTVSAFRTIIPQFPIVEIRQNEAGNISTRNVTHFIRRGDQTITGGTWSLPSKLLGTGTATINSSTGTVTLSGIIQSGSYAIRYVHTDGVPTELVVNVTFIAQAAGVRSITATPALVGWFEGTTTTVTVNHVAREDATALTGGTWSKLANTTGTVTVNSSTGDATITGVTASGGYTIRYTPTSGGVIDKTINIEFYPDDDPGAPPPGNGDWNTP